jgi:ketosteroid isomerase-like protein
MTPEELVRGAFDVFDEHGFEAATELWHPDIEYHEAPDFPGAGSYRGRDAVRSKWAEYLEIFGDETRGEVGRVETRGERAAWTVRFSGHTREGLPHDHTWGYVGRFEDDLLIECRAHYDADQAFAALESEG